jgi:hypothetical protein
MRRCDAIDAMSELPCAPHPMHPRRSCPFGLRVDVTDGKPAHPEKPHAPNEAANPRNPLLFTIALPFICIYILLPQEEPDLQRYHIIFHACRQRQMTPCHKQSASTF